MIRYDLDIERLKIEHCNHKCITCKHRLVDVYEDDTSAGRTPYHYWVGKCAAHEFVISHNVMPPKNCDYEKKEMIRREYRGSK